MASAAPGKDVGRGRSEELPPLEAYVLSLLETLWRTDPAPGMRELLQAALEDGGQIADPRTLTTLTTRLEAQGVLRIERSPEPDPPFLRTSLQAPAHPVAPEPPSGTRTR